MCSNTLVEFIVFQLLYQINIEFNKCRIERIMQSNTERLEKLSRF
jgi:hypothetical protein